MQLTYLRQKTHKFAFLRFAVLPLLALWSMNELLDLFISDIAQLGTTDTRLADRYETASGSMVALSEGRLRFMTFFYVASFLYTGVALYGLYLIRKYSESFLSPALTVLGIAVSGFWIYNSLVAVPSPHSYELLFSITNDIALSRYDNAFSVAAFIGAKIHFAIAIIATLLAILGGCHVMKGVGDGQPMTLEVFEAKRNDLKLLLILASLLLTFMAIYVSEWMAWPASFVVSESSPNSGATGQADEIRMLASGIRLYFGTGYSFTMLAFAIPAILTFSKQFRTLPMRDEDSEPAKEFLFQSVFGKEELGVLTSIFAPIIVPVISTLMGS